jgi:REP element-mobilizing transposase RayT
MSRGNGGQDIFLNAQDHVQFMRILSETKSRTPFELYAYCLMPNHFHLLIRQRATALAQIMQTALTRYASYLNRIQGRRGHVFQSRYTALLCTDDAYFLTVLRYIHENPVRAGLAKVPEDWQWSSYRDYQSARADAIVDTTLCQTLLRAQPAGPEGPHRESPVDQRRMDLADLGKVVCEEAGITMAELCGLGKQRALAAARRSIVVRALSKGFRPTQIARYLQRSPALVSRYAVETKV